jgi:hypothetical protein
MLIDRRELLRASLTDPRFQQIARWLRFAVIDDARIAYAIATLNPGFVEYALNKITEERVLAGKQSGKADEVYVVFARIDGSYKPTFTGFKDAEELHRQIVAMGLQPRPGRFGEFYQLPSVLVDSEDDPI